MRKTFLTLVFLPHAVPSVIAALIWSYLFAPGISPIVAALGRIGIHTDLLSPHLVMGSIAGIGVWEWTDYNAIIIFTSLQAVPHEILEAARVDGASELRATLSIKLPQILPALAVALLFTIIGTLQLFTEPPSWRSRHPASAVAGCRKCGPTTPPSTITTSATRPHR